MADGLVLLLMAALLCNLRFLWMLRRRGIFRVRQFRHQTLESASGIGRCGATDLNQMAVTEAGAELGVIGAAEARIAALKGPAAMGKQEL